MSRFEKLISELCPNGVEYKKLGDVCEFVRGNGISKADKGTGDIPVILYGELYTTYGNYITEVYSKSSVETIRKSPMIKRGDLVLPISSTTKEAQIGKVSVYCCDYNAYLGGDAILLRHNQHPNYLVHLLNGSWFERMKMKCTRGTTINHLNPKQLAEIEVPIPPLEIQKEIASTLDKFSILEEELEEELLERRKQYGYYRNELLTFNNFEAGKMHVLYKKLCEVSDMQRGTAITQKMAEKGNIPVISGGREPAYYCSISNRTGETITIAGSGAGAGYVAFWDKPIFVADAFSIKGKDEVLTKYLYHYLQNIQDKIYSTQVGGGVPHVHISSIENFEIPIPSIDVQKRIVDILDNFEKICTDLNIGLPAEIEARQKQYEYYRDKLLQFTPVVDERERERESIASY